MKGNNNEGMGQFENWFQEMENHYNEKTSAKQIVVAAEERLKAVENELLFWEQFFEAVEELHEVLLKELPHTPLAGSHPDWMRAYRKVCYWEMEVHYSKEDLSAALKLSLELGGISDPLDNLAL